MTFFPFFKKTQKITRFLTLKSSQKSLLRVPPANFGQFWSKNDFFGHFWQNRRILANFGQFSTKISTKISTKKTSIFDDFNYGLFYRQISKNTQKWQKIVIFPFQKSPKNRVFAKKKKKIVEIYQRFSICPPLIPP